MWKFSYKMLVLYAFLIVFLAHQAWFWSSLHVKKNSARNFSISASKIHLAEVPSLNPDHSCTARAIYGEIRAILVRAKRLSNFLVGVGPQGRSAEALRSRLRRQKRCMVFQQFRSAWIFFSQRTQNHAPFCQQDGDRRALFVTGVCSASAVAVSLELRALPAVPARARFLRNKRTHPGMLNALSLPL
jgi:hypothetical protein